MSEIDDAPRLVGCRSNLGFYLRGLRKSMRKVSLDDMANAIGCSKSYLWEVETDRANPSLRLSIKIAKHYKTTVARMAKEFETLVEIP